MSIYIKEYLVKIIQQIRKYNALNHTAKTYTGRWHTIFYF